MKIIYLESNLFEKSNTKPDKQAAKMLVNSGLFTEEEATQIIDELFTQKKIDAFKGAKSWLDKYTKGIARMIIEEANGDKDKALQFINDIDTINIFDKYLKYVKANRDKQEDTTSYDKKFVETLSFDDIKNFVEKYQAELDQLSKDELKNMKFTSSSNYDLIPIDSYEEMHEKFGGSLTGDGSSDGYAGDGHGGTAWCHTNSKSVYDSSLWTDNGKNKFFVLAKKGFEDIPFNSETNSEMSGKDDYGTSLIAILVDRYGNLKNATLRCNHKGVYTNPDNQYETYAELSKVAGFNVEEKIKELGNFEENPMKDGVYYYNGKKVTDELRYSLEKVVVKDTVTEISKQAFEFSTLKSIVIPDSVTTIGKNAFLYCKDLTSITLPNSLTKIGDSAFYGCSLKKIKIPNSVNEIEMFAFAECSSLETVVLPKGITELPLGLFQKCTSLKNIKIPNNVTDISGSIFQYCTSLESIVIPDSVGYIGYGIFLECTSLKSVKLSKKIFYLNSNTFQNCTSLESVELPEGLDVIADYVFLNCTSLKTLTIPENVHRIGDGAFENCPNLTIQCYKESVAEQYCIDNNIKYETI